MEHYYRFTETNDDYTPLAHDIWYVMHDEDGERLDNDEITHKLGIIDNRPSGCLVVLFGPGEEPEEQPLKSTIDLSRFSDSVDEIIEELENELDTCLTEIVACLDDDDLQDEGAIETIMREDGYSREEIEYAMKAEKIRRL